MAPPSVTGAGDVVDAASTPDDMFRATEGRWGSREVEITRVTFVGEDGAAGHVFQAGERDRGSARRPRAQPTDGLRLRHRHLQRRRRLLLRHQHRHRGAQAGRAVGDGQVDFIDREPRPGRRHLQARRRRAPARRQSVRLPPAALHVPREVAEQGRRHLPAAPPLGVLADACGLCRTSERMRRPDARRRRGRSCGELRRQRKAIVFTNGVYDLLHPGHVRYLKPPARSATR